MGALVRVGDGVTNNLSLWYTNDFGDSTQCRDGRHTWCIWRETALAGMEEKCVEVDQQRELVMNAIFIVGSDNLPPDGEINRQKHSFKLSKTISSRELELIFNDIATFLTFLL